MQITNKSSCPVTRISGDARCRGRGRRCGRACRAAAAVDGLLILSLALSYLSLGLNLSLFYTAMASILGRTI